LKNGAFGRKTKKNGGVKLEESKKKLNELEEWINAYDTPVDRACVADIFYDLKDEIEYWRAMYSGCLEECENLIRLKDILIEEQQKELEAWRAEGMI
jgi:hypothetical protein